MRINNNRLVNKISGTSGESISETLVALLISALALVMLAGVISTSSRIIDRERKKLETYYTEQEKLVTLQKNVSETTITIKYNGTAIGSPQTVKYYSNDTFSGKPVIAYNIEGGSVSNNAENQTPAVGDEDGQNQIEDGQGNTD